MCPLIGDNMLKDNYKKYRTDKFSTHSYLEPYGMLFDHRGEDVKNVLEIGIQNGGSLEIWSDLFPKAKIYGVDINPLPSTFQLSDRMTHIIGNAYDVNFINKHFNSMKFDVIIDDGPHTLDSMLFFARHYSYLLANNGVMAIEDVASPTWINQIIKTFPATLQPKVKFIDYKSGNRNVWDDILIYVDTSK